MNDDDVEVVQKLNPIRILQANLEGFNQARTPASAALHLARVYQNLQELHDLDADFQHEWSGILGGHFLDHVGNSHLRHSLRWKSIWSAESALRGLMSRRSMSFHAQLRDPIEAREAGLMSIVEAGCQGQLASLQSEPSLNDEWDFDAPELPGILERRRRARPLPTRNLIEEEMTRDGVIVVE